MLQYLELFICSLYSRYVPLFLFFLEKLGIKYSCELIYARYIDSKIYCSNSDIFDLRNLNLEDIRSGKYLGEILCSADDPVHHNESLGRIYNGNLGIIAVKNGNVIGYAWINILSNKYQSTIERIETFELGEVLIYDLHVQPKYRRIGVSRSLVSHILIKLKLMKYNRCKVFIKFYNCPSTKLFSSMQFKPIKKIFIIKLRNSKRIIEKSLSNEHLGEFDDN